MHMHTHASSARHYAERVLHLDDCGAYNLAFVELGTAIRFAEHDEKISISWVRETREWVCENLVAGERLHTRNPCSVARFILTHTPE